VRRSRRSWWWAFGVSSAAVAGALLWITVTLLRTERAELRAREAGQALWWMDGFVAPFLVKEASRPYFEYSAYYPQQTAYTRMLSEIRPGEVLTPSQLLATRSEFVRLHFQFHPERGLSSPEVPTGNHLDLAEATILSRETVEKNERALAEIGRMLSPDDVRARILEVEGRLERLLREGPSGGAARADSPAPDAARQEFRGRAQTVYSSKWAEAQDGVARVEHGPLVAFWTGREDSLVFARRVRLPDVEIVQGFLADWPRLKDALLEQVSGIFPKARLLPAPDEAAAGGAASRLLANVPVVLETGDECLAPVPWLTPARATIAFAWIAVIAAGIATALTLRSSVLFGEERSRFASAVTHELRTPLTTFRMYSEMLADGMVEGEERRAEYHATLKRESERLSRLVESVLAYARIEEGKKPASRRERMPAGALLERVAPALKDRARDAGLELVVSCDGAAGAAVAADADAVGQILFNLVDNACKYAAPSRVPRIDIEAARENGLVLFRVRDHGPGVAREHASRIFEPFDRGGVPSGDAARPGVGLGLALSRGLARDQGGDLTLDAPAGGPGARFTLRLPEAPGSGSHV